MRFKVFILIVCLFTAPMIFAIRGDGSRIQNFRNNYPNYNGSVVIQQNYGYPSYYTPNFNGNSFNPNDAFSYTDSKGNLIYYTTDLNGNTVYFRYNADGQIVHVDPLHP